MHAQHTPDSSRRRFLQFLASSPLLATATTTGMLAASAARLSAADAPPGRAPATNPADAINVFDLEAIARATLPIAHFAYLATGVEGEVTIRANREGFAKLQLRPRRLVDTTKLDTRVELFGETWPTPIFLAPASSQKAFHPEGVLAVARAARVRNHLQLLSTLTSDPVEEVNAARGQPVWFQLYPTTDWSITRALIKRAEAAGCRVLVLTLDNPTNAGRETLLRGRLLDSRNCLECHEPGVVGYFRPKRMFDGLDVSRLTGPLADHLTWEFVQRLRDTTAMKIVLKGIVTAEDATFALEHKVDGVIVSNHGGRGEDSGRSSIDSLPEVVAAIGGKVPVLIDSGFRRGTDIFKALALGADAVGVGRPYLWGLAAYGQPGVERCLEILTAELESAMRYFGAPTRKDINRAFVQRA